MFVGIWVILIADDVLFMCWPPAPEARYVSTLKSSGFILISTSSVISGNTSNEANDVWRLPPASNGEILTNLWTPISPFKYPYAYGPDTRNVTLFIPASSPAK